MFFGLMLFICSCSNSTNDLSDLYPYVSKMKINNPEQIIAVSQSSEHIVALRKNKTVIANTFGDGRNSYSECNVEYWKNIKQYG